MDPHHHFHFDISIEKLKTHLFTTFEKNLSSPNQPDLFDLQFSDEDHKKFGNLTLLENLYVNLRSFPTGYLTDIDERYLGEGKNNETIKYFVIDDSDRRNKPKTVHLQNKNVYNQESSTQNTSLNGTRDNRNKSNLITNGNVNSQKINNFRKNVFKRRDDLDRSDSSSDTGSTKRGFKTRPSNTHSTQENTMASHGKIDIASPPRKSTSSLSELSFNQSTINIASPDNGSINIEATTNEVARPTLPYINGVELPSKTSLPNITETVKSFTKNSLSKCPVDVKQYESHGKITLPSPTNEVVPNVNGIVEISSKHTLLNITETVKSFNKSILPKGNADVHQPYEVIFGDQNAHTYFVRKKNDQVLIDDIALKLKQEILIPWTKDSMVDKVTVRIDNILYRACYLQKTERTSGTLCFKLVDVGWIVDISPSKGETVYILPNSVKTIKPLSFTIQIINTDKFIERNKVATIVEKDAEQKTKIVEIVKFHEDIVDCNKQQSEQSTLPIYDINNYADFPISVEETLELHKQVDIIYSGDDPEDSDYKWVYPTSYEELHEKIQSFFIKNNFNYLSTLPKVGDFCLREMPKGVWTRFKVIGHNPLKIFSIDMGVFETLDRVDLNEFQAVPHEFAIVKPFAFKVRLRDTKTKIIVSDRLIITPVEYNDRSYAVLVEGEKIPSEPEKVVCRQSAAGTNDLTSVEELAINRNERLELNKLTSVVYTVDDAEDDQIKWFRKAPYDADDDVKYHVIGKNSVAKFEQTPQLGQFCVSLYEDLWCRAKVVKIEPLTVFFIDFGNSEIVKLNDIKPLPQELTSYSPLALKMKFYYKSNNKKTYEYQDTLSIIPVQFVNGVHVVLLENEKEDIGIIMERVYASQVAQLDLNKPVNVMWIDVDSHNEKYVWVQLLDVYATAINFYTAIEADSTQKLNDSPQLGELCMKEFEGVWCGAKVVSINPLHLFYFDYGNVEKVDNPDELRLLPERIKQLDSPAGLRIQLLDKPPSAGYGDDFIFTPIQKRNNLYMGSLSN